jgi:hypothetical protein
MRAVAAEIIRKDLHFKGELRGAKCCKVFSIVCMVLIP